MSSAPTEISGVTALTKANVYFGGKVISHAIVLPDGSRKTLGVILPGSYSFGTGQPEVIQLISGACRVKQQGEADWKEFAEGETFRVAADSGFEIEVNNGICEYLCSFLA